MVIEKIKKMRGALWRKVVEEEERKIKLPGFRVEGPPEFAELPPLTEVEEMDVAYALIVPFANAHIKWDPQIGQLRYLLEEPPLSKDEEEALKKISDALIDLIEVELTAIKKMDGAVEYLENQIKKVLEEVNITLKPDQYTRIMYYVYRDFVGLNEIEPLMRDPWIEDIGCDGVNIPFYVVHRKYGSLRTNIVYDNLDDLREFVIKLAERCGRYVSYAEPILEGTLPDGSRVSATLAGDVATRGPTFSIRKFTERPFSPIELIGLGTVSTLVMAYFWYLVESGVSLLVAGGVATGKCISPEDYVQLADGEIIEAEKLHDRVTKSGSPIKLLTLSNNPLSIERVNVNKFWKLRADTLFSVKTRRGVTISTTPEHPFFCMRNGEIKKVRADELKKGEWVASARFLPVKGKSQPINVLDYDVNLYAKNVQDLIKKLCKTINKPHKWIAEKLNVKYGTFKPWLRNNSIPITKLKDLVQMANYDIDEANKEIKSLSVKKSNKIIKNITQTSPELVKIIGYVLADGNIQGTYVNFYNSNQKLRNEFRDLMKKVFGIETITTHQKNRVPRIQACSLAVAEILNKVFGIPKDGKKADIIEIPILIQRSTLKEVSNFLSALFDCESYVSKKQCEIEFSTASEKFAKQLPYLLQRFGIVTRVKIKNVKGKRYYKIIVSDSKNLKKFREKIGYAHPEKIKKLNNILRKTQNYSTNVDLVPANKIIKLVCNENAINNSQLARASGLKRESVRDIIREKVNPERITLDKIVEGFKKLNVIDKNVKILEFLANSDIFWDKIEDVKLETNGKEFVYDVTVDNTHNFVAGNYGGLIISNTTFLNSLCMFIPPEAKIVSIEDTRELQIPHEHWIPTVTRIGFGIPMPTGEKYGEITLFDLLRGSFRQNPDYVIVGEVRGKEAYVMFQGMSAGHPSMGTFHAGSIDTVIKRLTTPPIELSSSLVESLDVILIMVHAKEKGKAARRVKEVEEVISVDTETFEVNAFRSVEWDPKTDGFIFDKNGVLLKKIARRKGIDLKDTFDEIAKRKAVLDWMVQTERKDYADVAKVINEYYKSPEELLAQVGPVKPLPELKAPIKREAPPEAEKPEEKPIEEEAPPEEEVKEEEKEEIEKEKKKKRQKISELFGFKIVSEK